MSVHTIKGLRESFKAVGKFHTPPELALALRGLVPGEPECVYDPTCGAGALLSAFAPETPKYGQDIDSAALADAELLPNFTGHHGDVLTNPAWLDRRFPAVVANPPFSIKWSPRVDERFAAAPTIPSAGRADMAFILHCLHMLTSDGTAVILCFPGVLYRGQREGAIRSWLVEQNHVEQVISVPGGTFTDTSIGTAILVLRKHRSETTIRFEDRSNGLHRDVDVAEVLANGCNLSVTAYVQPPPEEREAIDPWELEQAARRHACKQLRKELGFSRMVADMEGWPFAPFLSDLREVVNEFEIPLTGRSQ